MTIFNLEAANLAIDPSGSGPLFFCVADAGIESTPFEREGRAMVTREAGAGAVMAVGTPRVPAKRKSCCLFSGYKSDPLPQTQTIKNVGKMMVFTFTDRFR